MKYYETLYEEYISSVEKFNIHPELLPTWDRFPKHISKLENMIIYGPPGVGKYSQVLYLLKKYSPSQLKYDKKIIAQTDKHQFAYSISDIHYEIDMSLLGCNSKILWHEIFFQIVDIISVKTEKYGILICKNFHHIHSELLEIFYSYIQQYNHSQTNIKIIFFIITENISFIPNTITQSSHILRIGRPTSENYHKLLIYNNTEADTSRTFIQRIAPKQEQRMDNNYIYKSGGGTNILQSIDNESIVNIKEARSFPLLGTTEDIPDEVFNIICDNVIKDISSPEKIVMTVFRDKLYDFLTYNLDMNECLWYIIKHFIDTTNGGHLKLSSQEVSDILIKTYSFLKQFNNNYRPIFHLESMMYYIINKLHKF